MKNIELKNVGFPKARRLPDDWLRTEFNSLDWNFIGATDTKEIIYLDNIVSIKGEISQGYSKIGGTKGLFCLLETKHDYGSDKRKSDRVICGTDEDEVIKFSNEHGIL